MTSESEATKAPPPIKAVPVRHPLRWVSGAIVLVFVAMVVNSFVQNSRYSWGDQWHYAFTRPILDGVVTVRVDGSVVAELGPGAVIGERALLESGRRTSTVTALTRTKVACVPAASLDRDALSELSGTHRREEA